MKSLCTTILIFTGVGVLTLGTIGGVRADYGARIKGVGDDVAVWWCHATRKVLPKHVPPAKKTSAARLSAAKNDHEAVQIVVSPARTLKGLTATVETLVGPDGVTIPAENVKVLRVFYHLVEHPSDPIRGRRLVEHPSDHTDERGRWPDALPPLKDPIDVAADENQPLWLLVYVPEDAKAGDYSCRVHLAAEGWSAIVPVKLHVWDFALPRRNHLETAFGLRLAYIVRYHQLQSEADIRRVLDMYFECYAEHRISPYNPAKRDPIRVEFLPNAQPPRAEVDFSDFDLAMARGVKKYHFTNFMLSLKGISRSSSRRRGPDPAESRGQLRWT